MDTPALALSPADGEELFKAAANVARHYSIDASQKAIDVAALIGIAGAIYVPRIAILTQRIHKGAPRRATAQPPPPPAPWEPSIVPGSPD